MYKCRFLRAQEKHPSAAALARKWLFAILSRIISQNWFDLTMACMSVYYAKPFKFPDLATSHERRQRERVTTVLHAEDAEKETVHAEHDTSEDKNHGLLELSILNARSPVGKPDRAESQYRVCIEISSGHGILRQGILNVQMKATICDSIWN